MNVCGKRGGSSCGLYLQVVVNQERDNFLFFFSCVSLIWQERLRKQASIC